MLLLLIDNYHTEIFDRCKNCASCAYDYVCIAVFDPLPGIKSFTLRKSRMDYRYSLSVL